MTITNPVGCLVGNSEAISWLKDPLRSQVTVLYTAFWKVWDSRTSPFEFGALGAIFFVGSVLTIRHCFAKDTQLLLCLILGMVYGYGARTLYLEYNLMYREGTQEFTRLLQELPDANQALKLLFKIEPWRMALLEEALLPRLKPQHPYGLRLF
ncbi:hypothetical protein KBD61_05855 [Patescibacteria group bacterium]|nr:hypothetical protein [Patescibacteria group bacterium]